MKKFISVLLVLAFLSFMQSSAAAGDYLQSITSDKTVISPMYTYFTGANCNLSISGSGAASMDAAAQCISTIDKIRILAYLQKYNGGWQTINTWSQYYYSNTASWSQSDNVTSGYNYRLYVCFYAYDAGLLVESVVRTDTYEY